jgi:hypothetical protein
MDAAELRNALRAVARVLEAGEATHPAGNSKHWLTLSIRDHCRHAMTHLERSLLDVRGKDDDLAHAATRLLLALERRERDAIAVQSLRARVEQRRAG